MANNRVAIRSAFKTMLSGNTSAGTNIYTNRSSEYWQSELPAILIRTPEEPVELESMRSSRYIRTLTIDIEVRIAGTTSVDDDLDTLLASIETLIAADPSIGGTVISTLQTNTQTRVDEESDPSIGVGILSFESKYIG